MIHKIYAKHKDLQNRDNIEIFLGKQWHNNRELIISQVHNRADADAIFSQSISGPLDLKVNKWAFVGSNKKFPEQMGFLM